MKKLKALSVFSVCVLALGLILASCEDNISFTNPGTTNPGTTNPGTTNPGGNNGGLDSVTGLANKLAWLKTNAQSGGNYVIEVNANETIGYQQLSYPGKNNITITLKGIGANRIISFSRSGDSFPYTAMFTVSSGVNLVLENNITLYNNKQNSVGVFISGSGKNSFTMNGGSISGFSTGVQLESNYDDVSTFNMKGGNVSNNDEGVRVYMDCTFNMQGNASVSGNSSCGVVICEGGNFTMTGGTISGNNDGGVSIDYGGKFIMTGGTISNNTATYHGGGVYVSEGGTFNNNYPSGIKGNKPDDVYFER